MVTVLPMVHSLPGPHTLLCFVALASRQIGSPALAAIPCAFVKGQHVHNAGASGSIISSRAVSSWRGHSPPFPGTEGGGEWSRADSLDALGRAQQRCGPASHKDNPHIAAHISILAWRRISCGLGSSGISISAFWTL